MSQIKVFSAERKLQVQQTINKELDKYENELMPGASHEPAARLGRTVLTVTGPVDVDPQGGADAGRCVPIGERSPVWQGPLPGAVHCHGQPREHGPGTPGAAAGRPKPLCVGVPVMSVGAPLTLGWLAHTKFGGGAPNAHARLSGAAAVPVHPQAQ